MYTFRYKREVSEYWNRNYAFIRTLLRSFCSSTSIISDHKIRYLQTKHKRIKEFEKFTILYF